MIRYNESAFKLIGAVSGEGEGGGGPGGGGGAVATADM